MYIVEFVDHVNRSSNDDDGSDVEVELGLMGCGKGTLLGNKNPNGWLSGQTKWVVSL